MESEDLVDMIERQNMMLTQYKKDLNLDDEQAHEEEEDKESDD